MTAKKIIIRVALFLTILFLADRGIGKLLEYLYFNSTDFTTKKLRYSFFEARDSILILGSSRAQHHYIPDTITKYTGLSSYNCGIGGQGITFSYLQLHSILEFYRPKLIVLDVSPNVLIDVSTSDKIKILLPLTSRNRFIKEQFEDGSITDLLKFTSAIYPFNSTFFSSTSSKFYYKKDSENGYLPIFGELTDRQVKESFSKNQIHYKWESKLSAIVDLCKSKKVHLVLAISPIFNCSNNDEIIIDEVKRIASLSAIKVIDYSKFDMNNRHLFKDKVHLNNLGSSLYSIEFSKELINEIH